jgi:hypothetical protein
MIMCLSEKMSKMQNFLCAGESSFSLSVLPCTYLKSLFVVVDVVNSLHLFHMSLAYLLVAVNCKYTTSSLLEIKEMIFYFMLVWESVCKQQHIFSTSRDHVYICYRQHWYIN